MTTTGPLGALFTVQIKPRVIGLTDLTAEQKARDLMEACGVENAQSFSAGDVVALANYIADYGPEEDRGANGAATVWDIYVKDGTGAGKEELLVFSNQGYVDRDFAVSIALKLFRGRRAKLEIYDGDGYLDSYTWLDV